MKPVMVLAIASLFTLPAHAGIHADDLSRCLAERSTTADKLTLVKWMFSASARHPAVKEIASITPAQSRQISKDTAEMFVRMLSEVCQEETRRAVKYEGEIAIQLAFGVLGQVAGQELFSTPEVTESLAELERYVDTDKLEATFSPQ